MAESSLDHAIALRCAKRGAYQRKNHGGQFSRVGMLDHTIYYRGVPIELEAKELSRVKPAQLREIRTLQKHGVIAEVIWNVSLLTRIFDSIDSGEKWKNVEY